MRKNKYLREERYSVVLLGGPHHNRVLEELLSQIVLPNYVECEEWDTRGYKVFRFKEGANLTAPVFTAARV